MEWIRLAFRLDINLFDPFVAVGETQIMAKLRVIPNLFNGYKRRYLAQKEESIRLNQLLQERNLEILTLRDEVTKLANQEALHSQTTDEEIIEWDDFLTTLDRGIAAQMDELDALIARISKP